MDFEKQELTIDGMHCDACVRRVMHALGDAPGVRVESVDIGRAVVLAQPGCKERISKALDDQGYVLREMHATG